VDKRRRVRKGKNVQANNKKTRVEHQKPKKLPGKRNKEIKDRGAPAEKNTNQTCRQELLMDPNKKGRPKEKPEDARGCTDGIPKKKVYKQETHKKRDPNTLPENSLERQSRRSNEREAGRGKKPWQGPKLHAPDDKNVRKREKNWPRTRQTGSKYVKGGTETRE